MKKLIFLILLATTFLSVRADVDSCLSVTLATEKEIKAAEPCIIELSDFVLGKSLQTQNTDVGEAMKIVMDWVEKTPDYTFTLNEHILKCCDKKADNNIRLYGVYLSCLSKAALTNKGDYKKDALEMFVNYARNPKNKVKETSEIKKLIKAWDEGKVDKYLK
jgi:hypothetical protein